MKYAAHVRREIYEYPEDWTEAAQNEVEKAWPEYKDSTVMINRPIYQKEPEDLPAATWRPLYMRDVQAP
eukprot:7963080-Prorocentrum_lima.AAC.1